MKNEIQEKQLEQQQINELVQELHKLRNLAENTDDMNSEYACESMDESINEEIVKCLQEMNPYERLELLKNSLGLYTLKELVQGFKETCKHYGIKKNEDNES